MKLSVFCVMFMIWVLDVQASQQQPTRAELKQTIEHIINLSHQQEQDLNSVKAQLDTTQKNLNDAQTVEIPKLKNQIASQATELANDKIIVDQVNSRWGLGAFAYGFKMLFKHLLIMIAVLAVVAIGILVLSFFFPFIIPLIKMIGNVLAGVFNWIGSWFKK